MPMVNWPVSFLLMFAMLGILVGRSEDRGSSVKAGGGCAENKGGHRALLCAN